MPEYFPPSTSDCPTFFEDSEWRPLVDGEAYFSELSALLDGLGPGDGVVIAGLSVDPSLDLDGRLPADPGYAPLGERLARAAVAGATVRVLIAGRVLASSVPSSIFGDFRLNVVHANRFRAWRVEDGQPLRHCVLLDFSGALLGCNHQKFSVVLRAGLVTAFVGGIDLVERRFDAMPHNRLEHRGARWGWHDTAARLRGPAAAHVWEVFGLRWAEAATLRPLRYLTHGRFERLNPPGTASTPESPPAQPSLQAPGTSVRVLRSLHRRKLDAVLPWRRQAWDALPSNGIHEVFGTLVTAIEAARRYVYIEDQYLSESAGGDSRYELYPFLRAAAARGVKIVLVGSGIRDPDDPGFYFTPINRVVNDDVVKKVIEPLDPACRSNVVMYRVEHVTVHAKVVLVDDVFASIGSANMFSRSMVGTDNELCAAVSTTTSMVRDLRVQLWAEHLRAEESLDLRTALADLDLALGIFDPTWLPEGTDAQTWRASGEPLGFLQSESVWNRVPLPRGG